MSSRQLEDRMEEERDQAFANALGITLEDFHKIDADPQLHESDDGLLYGYNIYWSAEADPDILAKINGYSVGDAFVRIGVV